MENGTYLVKKKADAHGSGVKNEPVNVDISGNPYWKSIQQMSNDKGKNMKRLGTKTHQITAEMEAIQVKNISKVVEKELLAQEKNIEDTMKNIDKYLAGDSDDIVQRFNLKLD